MHLLFLTLYLALVLSYAYSASPDRRFHRGWRGGVMASWRDPMDRPLADPESPWPSPSASSLVASAPSSTRTASFVLSRPCLPTARIRPLIGVWYGDSTLSRLLCWVSSVKIDLWQETNLRDEILRTVAKESWRFCNIGKKASRVDIIYLLLCSMWITRNHSQIWMIFLMCYIWFGFLFIFKEGRRDFGILWLKLCFYFLFSASRYYWEGYLVSFLLVVYNVWLGQFFFSFFSFLWS